MNKIALVTFAILMLENLCGQNISAEKKDSYKNEISLKSKENLSNIIGEWGIYETIEYTENGTSKTEINSVCNACPKIKFQNDQTGILTYPNGEMSLINWKITESILTIENENEKLKYFDNNYEIRFTKENNFIELELKETKKKYSYILRK